MTLVIVVGTGIREETGWTNVCCWTVMLPFEVAAIACICSNTHAVAAPIPRTGSVWLEAVCLVPNETSFSTVASMRLGSTWLSREISAGSGFSGAMGGEAAAVELARKGTAAAADAADKAEADRNVRRVVSARLAEFLASMALNQRRPPPRVNRNG